MGGWPAPALLDVPPPPPALAPLYVLFQSLQTEGALESQPANAALPAPLLPLCIASVLFWSLRTEGTLDKGALHGSCPTTKGTKYAATKW